MSADFWVIPNDNSASWQWSLIGTGEIDFTGSIVHIFFSEPGLKTIRVTETDIHGCKHTSALSINVVATFDPDFEVVGFSMLAPTICKSQKLIFHNTTANVPQGNAPIWTVKNSIGTIVYSGSPQDLVYTFDLAGSYTVELNYYYNGLSCNTAKVATIIVNDQLPIEIECLNTGCEGQTSTYQVSDDCTELNWDVQGGTIASDQHANPIQINWNNVGPSGYGVIKVSGNCNPSACDGLYYVPVLPSSLTITGKSMMCMNGNNTYSVPPFIGAEYEWSIEAVNIISGTLPTLSNTVSDRINVKSSDFVGTFRLSVTATNALFGCSAMGEIEVSVYDFTFSPTDFCIGSDITLDITPPGMITGSMWTLSNLYSTLEAGASSGSQITLPATLFPTDGSYNVSGLLTLTDNQTCTFTHNFQMGTNPQVSIEGPDRVCSGVEYDYRVAYYHGTTGQWSVTGGTIIRSNSENTVKITWDMSSTHLVEYIYQNAPCPSATVTKYVKVVNNEPLAIEGPSVVCADERATYSIPGVPENINWTISNGNGAFISSQTEQTVTIQWLSGGSNTAVLTVNYSLCGNPYNSNLPIEIRQHSINISGPDHLCVNSNGTFMVDVDYASDITWIYNGEEHPGQPMQMISLSTPGLQPVEVRVTDPDGCPGIFTARLWVDVQPTIDISIVNRSYILCPEGTIGGTLELLGQFEELGIQWYLDGAPISGATNAILPVTQNGLYTVTISNGSCTSTLMEDVALDCDGGGGDDDCDIPGVSLDIAQVTVGPCGTYSLQGVMSPAPSPLSTQYWIVPNEDGEGYRTLPIFSTQDLNTPPLNLSQAGYYNVTLAREGLTAEGERCLVSDVANLIIPFHIDDIVAHAYCDGGAYLADFEPIISHISGLTLTESWKINGDPATLPYTTTPGASLDVEVTIASASGYTCTLTKTLQIPPVVAGGIAIENGTTSCAGSTMFFHSQDITGHIIQYHWNFGDNTSSNAKDPAKQYENSGSYVVTLTVTDVNGCTSSSTTTVIIQGNPFDDYLLSDALNDCQSMATLEVKPTDNIVDFKWSPGSWPNTSSINVALNDLYSVTITDNQGCNKVLYVNINNIDPAFASMIQGESPLCSKYTNNRLSFETATGFSYSAHLNPGNINISISINQSTGYLLIPNNSLTSGNYTITITAERNNVSCGTISREFKIEEPIVLPQINISVENCEPYQVTLYTDDESNVRFWPGDVKSNRYSVPYGVFDVFVFAVEENKCGAGRTDIDIPPAIDFNLFLTGCFEICDTILDNGELKLTGISGRFASWQWKLNGVNIAGAGGTNSTVSPLVLNATYEGKITLWVSNGYCEKESEPFCLEVSSCGCYSDTLNLAGEALCLTGTNYDEQVFKFSGQIIKPHSLSGWTFTDLQLTGGYINNISPYQDEGIYKINGFVHVTDYALLLQQGGKLYGSIKAVQSGDTCIIPVELTLSTGQFSMCAMPGLMCMNMLNSQIYTDYFESNPNGTYTYHMLDFLPFQNKGECQISSYTLSVYHKDKNTGVLTFLKNFTVSSLLPNPRDVYFDEAIIMSGTLHNSFGGLVIDLMNNCGDTCNSIQYNDNPLPFGKGIENRSQILTNNSLDVNPNPAANTLHISYSCEDAQGTLSIMNLSGVQVYHQSLNKKIENNILVDISKFPSEIYIVSLNSQNCVFRKQVVVIK